MAREPRRLNWGCGPNVIVGWWNSDIVDHGQEHVGDIRDRFPCRDGFFDLVVANHSLQALPYDALDDAVAEFRRVLRPDGIVRVIVPDVLAAARAYVAGNDRWAGFAAISEPWDLDRKFSHYLTWGGSNRSTFTERALKDLLARNGFDRLNYNAVAPYMLEADSRLDESLVVSAVR